MQVADLTGAVLDGRYQIIERLSDGAMGVVYRGLRLKLNRAVAIKVMHASLPDAMAGRERFEREAKLMALLEHPHCVSVIDYGLHDDKPYLVMELVRGRSLYDVLAEQRGLEVRAAADIMRQLLSGVAHAHEHGIIHRDIKPANVMITPKAPLGVHARLLDFGLARLRESSTSLTNGVAVGTPSYMAPEQCRGDELDARVDLYACGVVLFEMIAGRKPFVADDPIAIVKKQLDELPPRLADVADGDFGALEAVVARALSKSPRDRFASAMAMADAIDAALVGWVAPEPRSAPDDSAVENLGSSALVPIDASIDVPISSHVPSPPSDASSLRRMLPVSRMRYAVLAGVLLVAAAFYGLVVMKRDLGETERADAGTRGSASAVDRTAPPFGGAAGRAQVPAVEPDDAVAAANQLVASGKLDAALDVLAKARHLHPDRAALAYTAGKIYFAKQWWSEGIKDLRDAIRLDPAYRGDPDLIKTVLRGFVTTAAYDERLGAFVIEIGPAAAPFLDETARTHPSAEIRARASAELRKLR